MLSPQAPDARTLAAFKRWFSTDVPKIWGRDESLFDDFTPNTLVVPLPLYLDNARPVRANVSMEAGLLAEIDEAARRRGLTRSAFLTSAARDKIAADNGLRTAAE